MKIIISVTLAIIFFGCQDEKKLLNSELKGNVDMLTEYIISIRYDSQNNQIDDSLSITHKYYNSNNQIVERQQKTIFDNQEMNIKYEYDRFDNLIQERVEMSYNKSAFNVDYIYRNNLLQKTISKSISDSVQYIQFGIYQYDSQKQLIEDSTSQIFIDQRSGDTLRYSKEITTYGKNGIPLKSRIEFHNRPERNGTAKYYYKDEELAHLEEFDGNGSLIAKKRYFFKKDSLGNWIQRNEFVNDTLRSIVIRKIVYN